MNQSDNTFKVLKTHILINNVPHRECCICKQNLPLDKFGKFKRKSNPLGLNYSCKVCHAKRRKEYYHNNEEYRLNTLQQRVEQHREFKKKCIKYKGTHCQHCYVQYKENDNEAIFQFHHRNPKQKDFALSTARSRKFQSVQKELDKCDLLCANCHLYLHSKEIRKYKYNIENL